MTDKDYAERYIPGVLEHGCYTEKYMTKWALCLRHLAARIGEQRPELFSDYSLADILCLYRKEDFTRERATCLFGIRGGLAAYKLIQYGANRIRPSRCAGLYLSGNVRWVLSQVYPLFRILGWSEKSLISALAVLFEPNELI